MKIAYIGDFINHGKSLKTHGTSLVILLSTLDSVESIDVFCPMLNKEVEEFTIPSGVTIMDNYHYGSSLEILKLIKVSWDKYDYVIFNILPTGFGDGSIINGLGLLMPKIISHLANDNSVEILFHNSAFTNDIKTLGYNSLKDKFRLFFLKIIERALFKKIRSYVLLEVYKERLVKSIRKNNIGVINSRYIEAISTLYINNELNKEEIRKIRRDIPNILMHGYWGPQKNIEMGLSTLKNLRDKGYKFNLTVSGGINHHFPDFEDQFKKLLTKYKLVVDEYLGPVNEREIFNLFMNTDLLLLPYNAPGGHSGVLEQAIFFDVQTVAIDFPEYQEQAKGISNVKLTSMDNFSNSVYEQIEALGHADNINVKEKILEARENLKILIQQTKL